MDINKMLKAFLPAARIDSFTGHLKQYHRMMLNPLKDTLGDDIQRVDGRRSIQPDTLDEQKFFYSFFSRLLTLVMLLYNIIIIVRKKKPKDVW